MIPYPQMSSEEREAEYQHLLAQFEDLKAQNLKLNMARGKPGEDQLNLTRGIFDIMRSPEDYLSDGIEVRNYGEMTGLPAAKRLFAEVLGCREDQVFVGGNASLQLMYDTVAKGYTHGLLHSSRPWCKEEKLKWLCPAPGYDRHFKITESFGFELITVPMTDNGPDMDMVENAVKDPAVKGMWTVPKYSNPDGIVYSEETIRCIASLKPAAPDFLLMWDNAYCIHDLEDGCETLPDILTLCASYGNPDMVFEFASTSKITLPGAGISCFACSEDNMTYMKKLLDAQVISYDKVNQQRHVLYLKDKAHMIELMRKHAEILRPKFQCVLDALNQEIAPLNIASWRHPKGGYFVSLNAMPGTAKRTLVLCKEAGVTMTNAGATFPYGKDPQDSNIRIAPSFPSVNELKKAVSVLCVCLKLSALEKLNKQ
ncbi:Putative aminotransferase MSMEG_6286 [uncultured Clostridium sp.]|uniref:Aminotransferase class I/II-fold pyridoxal phosphate-dependent enzyme n=1 Tax=Flintibacter hominis TaxID=2763048 RepID=A0A8J6J6N8_9FIRM|nr:aminotransferase class I/II-fold pyridoxal phosphate-dependent enzyme [Flintibacter hominis]MBC5721616.1 aminotransferase class I/II-fold pyridoxal phosphate-dependent enzyme [Flintibacter hominis]SCH72680.1 Putative aminotransferase MSMEG_6286 [uncultured Clostridium sp.]